MGSQVDPSFIQESDHRPKPTITEARGIPLIDLSLLLTIRTPNRGDRIPEALKPLLTEVESACREWGFFQVINHGVPIDLLEGIQSAAKEFFALPIDEKRRVRREEENPLGYYDAEHTKNVRDWKEVFDFSVNEPMVVPATSEKGERRVVEVSNRWPEFPPYMRDACMDYSKAVEELAYKLLELIAMTLKLPAKRLNGYFKDSVSTIRLNHYPSCPSPDLALGVGRHKDPGALTILSQDEVGGLDVKRRSDGEWVRVKPIPNAYIINIGDLIQVGSTPAIYYKILSCGVDLVRSYSSPPKPNTPVNVMTWFSKNRKQVWSNDKYESAEHRVSVNSMKDRFSIPFFFNPAHNVTIRPLEELVSEDNAAKYNDFSWGYFFNSRKSSNFQKLGQENLQIYHFKKAE